MKKLAALPRITVAMSLAALPAAVFAQAAPVAQTELSEIEVLAKRVNARNRVDAAAPVLSYDEEYFQRFEPLSVGDMMKRVPGVSFQSDIGEYAEPSLRGIGSEYTQILVNGRRMTGGTNDNTVIVDRIPAELVERVEIIRSPSSDIDSQGVGGTLNIILKEGAELSGGIYRLGRLLQRRRDEPERVPVVRRQQRQLSTGARRINYQERFNRKAASELERALDGEGGVEPASRAVVEDPDERESTDIAWTGDVRVKLGEGSEWFASAFYMDTDRAETEIGREFAAEDDDGEFEAEPIQANQLDAFHETNYGVVHRLTTCHSATATTWEIELSYDETEFESVESNWEDDLDFDFDAAGITDADSLLAFLDQSDQEIIDLFAAVPNNAEDLRDPEFLDGRENTDADDSELVLKTSVDYQLGGSRAQVRPRGLRPQRDFSFRVFENEDGVLEEDDAGAVAVRRQGPARQRLRQVDHGLLHATTLELGGRGEFTSLDLDSTVSEALAEAADELGDDRHQHRRRQPDRVDRGHFEFNPSAHLRWDVTDRTQVRLSRRAHGPPAELRPAEPDAPHRRRGEHPRQPDARPGNGARLRRRRRLRARRPRRDPRLQRLLPRHQRQDRAGRRAGRRQRDLPGVRGRGHRGDGLGEQPERRQDLGRRARLQLAGHLHRPEPPRVRELHLDRLGDPRRQRELPDRPAASRCSPTTSTTSGFDHLIEQHRLHLGRELPEAGPGARSGSTSAPRPRKSPTSSTTATSSSSSRRRSPTSFVVRLAAQNLLDAEKDEIQRVYESVDQLQANTPVTTIRQNEESDPVYILTFRGTF